MNYPLRFFLFLHKNVKNILLIDELKTIESNTLNIDAVTRKWNSWNPNNSHVNALTPKEIKTVGEGGWIYKKNLPPTFLKKGGGGSKPHVQVYHREIIELVK